VGASLLKRIEQIYETGVWGGLFAGLSADEAGCSPDWADVGGCDPREGGPCFFCCLPMKYIIPPTPITSNNPMMNRKSIKPLMAYIIYVKDLCLYCSILSPGNSLVNRVIWPQ